MLGWCRTSRWGVAGAAGCAAVVAVVWRAVDAGAVGGWLGGRCRRGYRRLVSLICAGRDRMAVSGVVRCLPLSARVLVVA